MTQSDRSLLFRIGLVNQQRPLPPRSVRAAGGLVLWDPPSETGNITHYRIRVGSDTAPVKYCVPAGATAVRPGDGDSDFFVSSYNATMGTESELVAVPGSAGGGAAASPPTLPSDAVLSIVLVDGGYVAAVAWTKNAAAGGTAGYEIQLKIATASDGSAIESDWGFTEQAVGYVSEAYRYAAVPLPAEARWAKARVRAYNFTGEDFTAWVESPSWVAISPDPQEPTAPSSVVVSVDSVSGGYSPVVSWTKNATAGGTAGYEVQLRIAEDASGTVIEADWGQTEQAYGYDTESYRCSFRPSPSNERWIRARVRSFNGRGDQFSAWSESPSWISISTGAAGAPSQPASGDWSVASAIYRADKNGNQFARVRVTVAAIPSGADYVEAWLNSGYGYRQIGILTAPGDSDHWEPQPTSASTWYVKLTASRYDYVVVPGNDTEHPPKSLSITAWKAALALTSGTCSLQEMTWINVDGKKRYRMKHTAVGPSDENRQAIRVYRRWTDSSWTPVTGEPGQWHVISGVDATSGTSWTWYTAEVEGFPAPDTVTNYNQIAYVPINHAGDETWTGALTFNISFSPDGGFNATAIDPSTLGIGASIIDGALQVTVANAGLSNGDFSAGSKDWMLDSGWSIVTTDAYAGNALRGNGTGAVKYASSNRFSVIPGRILRASCYARSSLSGGTGQVYITFWTAADSFLSTSDLINVTGDSYAEYKVIATVPATAAYARFSASVPAAATSGRMIIDNVATILLEPVSGGLFRTSSGGLYIDSVEISKLTAGTATFTGDATFVRSGSGGQLVLNSSGVTISKVSGSSVTIGASSLSIDSSGSQVYLDSSGIVLSRGTDAAIEISSSDIKLKKSGTTRLWLQSAGVGSAEYWIYDGSTPVGYLAKVSSGYGELSAHGVSCLTAFSHSGSTVSITAKSAWRTALGLATTTLYYKDHSGANQTLANVVYVP